jgi:curved DNA-binding protein CbpA
MTDAFSVFEFSRAPWLDEGELKERFHRLSAARHPDVAGGSGEAFSELNEAYQILRFPVARLRHFLNLTAPEAILNSAAIPPEMGDMFMRVASLKQSVQRYSAESAAATSPLSRAMLVPQKLALSDELAGVESAIGVRFAEIENATRKPDATPAELAALLSQMTYFANWSKQAKELALAVNA